MPKLEVTKTIEARQMNKRNRKLLSEPPVTIPYGAILDDIVENGDDIEFMYLGELYQIRAEMLRSASHALEGRTPVTASASAAAAAPAPTAAPVTFVWEKLNAGAYATYRAKLPGGWLIAAGEGTARSIAFYPDPDHAWDGTTLGS